MAVLIISDYNDPTTDTVIEWILHYHKVAYRYTYEDFIKSFYISKTVTNNNLKINILHKKEQIFIDSFWFRMDTSNNYHENLYQNTIGDNIQKRLHLYLRKEILSSKQILFNNKEIKWLSDYNTININKFEILQKAKECDLRIPNTIFTNNKKDLLEFTRANEVSTLICKSIGENLTLNIENEINIYQPIKTFNSNNLELIPDIFSPSLFQQLVAKEFDIRVFYLDGKCYSMSIHSNLVDYRENYSEVRYNPIELPTELVTGIKRLMDNLGLNTGSLDFIKEEKTNKYSFLEINPNGQFGMLSKPCNYYLEKQVAKYLCNV